MADTIDNSISASASSVAIVFRWAGTHSYVAILDNGHGLSTDELVSAMRLGDRDPLQIRHVGDLGRFGLGLKTAAFSQGRRLTVASRYSLNELACFAWDLDILSTSPDGGWHLLEGAEESSLEAMELLASIGFCDSTSIRFNAVFRQIALKLDVKAIRSGACASLVIGHRLIPYTPNNPEILRQKIR